MSGTEGQPLRCPACYKRIRGAKDGEDREIALVNHRINECSAILRPQKKSGPRPKRSGAAG